MRRRSGVTLAACAALLFAASAFILIKAGTVQADGNSYKGNPYWGANHFPDVPLTTQDGQTVKFYSDLLKGKMVMINFIYTRCGNVCPLETAKIAQVYKLLGDRMGKDVFFYSITVDPKHDTPEVLKDYAQKFHAGPGWYFLTGKRSDIDLVRNSIGMANRPNEDPLTGHTTSLTIGNEYTGQWMVDSSMDDPRYVAVIAGDWLSSWQHAKKGPSYAEKPALDPSEMEHGGSLFRTSCSACHTVGKGDLIGPDLAGVTAVRDHAWLARFIQTPDKVLKEKDPIATALYKHYNRINMPNLNLTEKDAKALIRFIEKRSAEVQQQSPESGKSNGTENKTADTGSTN
jgi:protein SCO1